MSQLQTKIPTDTWVNASWEEYLQVVDDPTYSETKGYYFNGRMRLEMSPLGNPHSRDHFIVISAIALFASVRGIDLDGHDNCTYRKTGCEEAQPDVSFYLGANAEVIPWEATIIDLDVYPSPDLVIEVAYSSLADDKGEKRLLYEALGVREYWIIDVQNVQLIAFEVQNQGSRKIEQSQVFPGLDMALLEEALRRSRQMNHGKVSAWLLSQF
ncbi:MAG: Uma2 family endonuclease [Leptolyngbyaceae cyanobacterium RM2_2_4]|nr:Uma2 family endonuclease [Leptolyngbyaceae cyanobacterium SM1_4_3]NJN89567.1 Uma2 family endonuclease [Leptolyngbyaceae cyanobacterium SL_5_14]NJO49468.1 Uma2 family endonuclease [Leptolyngbyaceae cyanobacterium RM2_2_4]NJO66484.1 Uma2 family endonuclease [Leptolyngbyaceae cyanobacterium RM1_405_57]